MKHITFLSEGIYNPALLGGKGSNLVYLTQNNFPIPSGFIISTEAFKTFINNMKWNGDFTKVLTMNIEPKDVLTLSKKMQQTILKSSLPKSLIEEVSLAYSQFQYKTGEQTRFAVRSSATIEDAATFSFAGQAETFLYRKTIDEIIKSIQVCWASLFSPHALLYLLQMKKLGHIRKFKDMAMAVIVQKMIKSDISGVLFTANVLNNNKKEMLINSIWGLGEALANNMVIPDTLILDKHTGNTIKTIIGRKEKKSIPDSKNSCTRIIKTSQKTQEICCLKKTHIHQLFEIGLAIEKLYEHPQDIEWAIEDDTLFILQSRPITTLRSKFSNLQSKEVQ